MEHKILTPEQIKQVKGLGALQCPHWREGSHLDA